MNFLRRMKLTDIDIMSIHFKGLLGVYSYTHKYHAQHQTLAIKITTIYSFTI